MIELLDVDMAVASAERAVRSVSGNRLVTRATVWPVPSATRVSRPLSRGS